MRGKGHRDGQAGVLGGITPVYAGKRSPDLPARPSGWDHPRMCGEKPTLRCPCLPYRGSPPHVRGKDRLWQKRFHEVGITPACAGKRRAQDRQDPPRGDHPRMCGEKVSSTSPLKCLYGSPPHVRGKALGPCAGRVAVGITPACAGKSPTAKQRGTLRRDHPRMCGEKTKKIP